MSKVITFSKQFPKGHPKEGQHTFFIEKVWASLTDTGTQLPEFWPGWFDFNNAYPSFHNTVFTNSPGKHHTIRSGKRWKVGDKFSPRVWSGRPYASKQITFAPDIEIKKVFDFEMNSFGTIVVNGVMLNSPLEKRLFENDGLNEPDFLCWLMPSNIQKFNGFSGQIICWNENIEY